MKPQSIEELWRNQPVTAAPVNPIALLQLVQREEATFQSVIFWRDFREVVVGLLLIPLWIYWGITDNLPWTWYLGIPAISFTVGYLIFDRVRNKPNTPKPGTPVSDYLNSSIMAVQHQVWLLRNVFWWYLLPTDIAATAFFIQVGWNARQVSAVGAVFGIIVLCGFLALVSWGIYRLNQVAVQRQLLPRLAELQALRDSLVEAEPAPTTPH